MKLIIFLVAGLFELKKLHFPSSISAMMYTILLVVMLCHQMIEMMTNFVARIEFQR